MDGDERRLAELELQKLQEQAARTDRWQWRSLWIATVTVFAFLVWLLFRT